MACITAPAALQTKPSPDSARRRSAAVASTAIGDRLPMFDPTLPVDIFLPVDHPGDLAREWEPHSVVVAIVGETTSPRSREKGRFGRTGSIRGKFAGDPPFAVQTQHNFGRCL